MGLVNLGNRGQLIDLDYIKNEVDLFKKVQEALDDT